MIGYDDPRVYLEIEDFRRDAELLSQIKRSIAMQKRIGEAKRDAYFTPRADALEEVSGAALDRILDAAQSISDIRTHSNITNCIVFHTRNLDGSLLDADILDRRREIDRLVCERLRSLFDSEAPLSIECSGHFWYPPGGYMGWHTNLRKPGWRFYITNSEQPGRSFFRYQDPDSAKIVTAVDQEWDFRLFRICPRKPFWHAVYSETNRFSLGYLIVRQDEH